MSIALDQDALDVLCPMHVVVDCDGKITHVGPTFRKLHKGQDLLEQSVFDVLRFRSPRPLKTPADLREAAHQKLRLQLVAAPHTALKGVLVTTNAATGDMLLNLSFGMSILEGVRAFSLTNADFAATDLAMELMYLVEAKSAAMKATARLNARLQGAKIAAEEQAFTDTLTGLRNRRALETVLARLTGQEAGFALMQIDLDFFKEVNDTLGHAAGDHVLREVAQIMVDETRRDDLVARVGGDEFTIVLPEIQNVDVLKRIGERIIKRLEEPITFNGDPCTISVSIGAVWVELGESMVPDEVLENADVALYASKHAGRARQTLYHPDLRKQASSSARSGTTAPARQSDSRTAEQSA